MFVELHGATCLHCGRRAGRVCARCHTDTSVGPAVSLAPDAIRVGWIGRGRTASPAVWIGDPEHAAVYTSDARVLPAPPPDADRFVVADGPGSIRCDIAAVMLVGASPAFADLGGARLDAVVVDDRLRRDGHVDLPRARRAACELAGAGTPDLVAALPLSEGEVTWWSALALLRTGDRVGAVRQLGELPLDGYHCAAVVLRWAAHRWVGEASASARYLLDQRLRGSATLRLARVVSACGPTPLEHFLVDPTAPLPAELRSVPAALPTVGRVLALAGATVGEPIVVGPTTNPSVLDDLVDLGTALDPTSMSAEQRRQVLARTHPEHLSDADVAAAGLQFEHDRRLLAGGRIDEIDATRCDPHLRGIITLANDGVVADELRAVDPLVAQHLAAFLASPSAGTLTARLVADPSVWTLLARRLDAPLHTWTVEPHDPTQRFVGWMALRTTFDQLVEADWAHAVEAGQHALRLAADDQQRRAALDLVAFARWQRDDCSAARDALVEAIGGSDDIDLRVNLAIVSSSIDAATAQRELGGLIGGAGPLDLRGAAAMRAVDLWTTDELPWTVQQPSGLPDTVTASLRALVVEALPLPVFRAVARLLSTHDRDWMARTAHLGGSPHRSTVDARVYQARAAGPREFADALAFALRSASAPAWAEAERDRAVDTAVRRAFDDDGSSALFAMFAVQRQLPATPEQQAMLAPLAVLAMCAQLESPEPAPPAGYLQLLADADHEWRQRPVPVQVQRLMDTAWHRLAVSHVEHLDLVTATMQDALDELTRRVRRGARVRRDLLAQQDATDRILDDAIAADDVLSTLRLHVHDAGLRHDVDRLLRTVREIRRAAMRVL